MEKKKKLLGKLGEGKQWASGTWDPRTIPVHASSWGRVSSSKGGGNTAVSLQRGCQNSCEIKVASSFQQVSLMALGTLQAAGLQTLAISLGYLIVPLCLHIYIYLLVVI